MPWPRARKGKSVMANEWGREKCEDWKRMREREKESSKKTKRKVHRPPGKDWISKSTSSGFFTLIKPQFKLLLKTWRCLISSLLLTSLTSSLLACPFTLFSIYKFFKHPPFIYASGPLQLLFPLSRMLFTWLASSHHSYLSSYTHSSRQLSDCPTPASLTSWHTPTMNCLHNTHSIWKVFSHICVSDLFIPFPTET